MADGNHRGLDTQALPGEAKIGAAEVECEYCVEILIGDASNIVFPEN